jgi:hypothetical protein
LETRRAAVALAKRVVTAAPDVDAHRDGLLAAHLTLAELLARLGRADAAAEFAAAATVGRQMPSAPPKSERAVNRAECFRRLAIRDSNSNRPSDALAWLDRVVALIENDADWSSGSFRRDIEQRRAMALNRLGRANEAAVARARANECRVETPDAPLSPYVSP